MVTKSKRKARSKVRALKRGDENARKRAGQPAKAAVRELSEIEPVRDGFVWLIRKNRLSATRRAAAVVYRDAYREPAAGAMRSFLGESGGGSGGGGLPPDYNAAHVDAVRLLARLRSQALAGHGQMIHVMDGVVGGGLTLREMAGGDDRAAGKLEAVLMVALDLIAAWVVEEAPSRRTA